MEIDERRADGADADFGEARYWVALTSGCLRLMSCRLVISHPAHYLIVVCQDRDGLCVDDSQTGCARLARCWGPGNTTVMAGVL